MDRQTQHQGEGESMGEVREKKRVVLLLGTLTDPSKMSLHDMVSVEKGHFSLRLEPDFELSRKGIEGRVEGGSDKKQLGKVCDPVSCTCAYWLT